MNNLSRPSTSTASELTPTINYINIEPLITVILVRSKCLIINYVIQSTTKSQPTNRVLSSTILHLVTSVYMALLIGQL